MVLPVFDIKRYSINDGPGIRITIFFKGCPLSCVWCHNPEGISPRQTKLYTLSKCIGCGRCVAACSQKALSFSAVSGAKSFSAPDDGAEAGDVSEKKSVSRKRSRELFVLTHPQPGQITTDRGKCVLCGKCAEVCPTKAMEMASKNYSVEQLVAEVEKERPFFETSGGGVTLCGGEPLLQGEKLFSLLDALGERRVHRVVDTTLFAPEALVREITSRCELFLVDLKMMDSEKHRRFCGVPNELILSNIRLISQLRCKYIIRIPLIIGVNADEENLRESADFLASLPTLPEAVELLPYHDIARGKHDRLGTTYNPDNIPMSAPTAEQLAAAQAMFDMR